MEWNIARPKAMLFLLLCHPQVRPLCSNTPVGQYSHGGVKIHMESHLTRHTIDVKAMHADPQPVLDAIAASVAYHQRPRTLLSVVGQAQRRLRPSESRDGQLAQRAP